MDINAVKELMGHSKIDTTAIYLHYRPDPDTAAKLSAAWRRRGADGDSADDVVPLRRAV